MGKSDTVEIKITTCPQTRQIIISTDFEPFDMFADVIKEIIETNLLIGNPSVSVVYDSIQDN